MSSDPNAPITDRPGGLELQRAVGAVTLLIGGLLDLFFAFAAIRLLSADGTADAAALIFFTVVGVIAAFFTSAGWRLTFNRPNQHGSLLTPALWFVIAGLFLAGGLVMASLLAAQGRFIDLDAAAGALAFALLSALAGRRAARKKRDNSSRQTTSGP